MTDSPRPSSRSIVTLVAACIAASVFARISVGAKSATPLGPADGAAAAADGASVGCGPGEELQEVSASTSAATAPARSFMDMMWTLSRIW